MVLVKLLKRTLWFGNGNWVIDQLLKWGSSQNLKHTAKWTLPKWWIVVWSGCSKETNSTKDRGLFYSFIFDKKCKYLQLIKNWGGWRKSAKNVSFPPIMGKIFSQLLFRRKRLSICTSGSDQMGRKGSGEGEAYIHMLCESLEDGKASTDFSWAEILPTEL